MKWTKISCGDNGRSELRLTNGKVVAMIWRCESAFTGRCTRNGPMAVEVFWDGQLRGTVRLKAKTTMHEARSIAEELLITGRAK